MDILIRNRTVKQNDPLVKRQVVYSKIISACEHLMTPEQNNVLANSEKDMENLATGLVYNDKKIQRDVGRSISVMDKKGEAALSLIVSFCLGNADGIKE